MTVWRGTWGFALLPRCRLFVLCADAVIKIPSYGTRWKETTHGHHMAVVTKTEELRPLPWLAPQQDELNRIQAVGLLRLPSLKKNCIGFDRQTLRLFQESVWEHSCREWTSTLYYLGNRLWRPSFPKFAFFIPKIYSPGVIHYTKQAWWITLILKHVPGIPR